MYIRRLEIQDFRAFSHVAVDLLHPGRRQRDGFAECADWPVRLPNVNILLGVNGAGKTTILEAIALALLSPVIASSGYRPLALIRRSNRGTVKRATITAELALHDQDGVAPARGQEVRERLETVIERRGTTELIRAADEIGTVWDGMFDDKSPSFFLVGYGATRRVEALSAADLATRRKSRLLRYERVASLFEDHFALVPLNAWLPRWKARNPERHEEVVKLINRLTPSKIKFAAEMEDGEYLFRQGSVAVPFSALSDGYRAYIGWVGDLLYHLGAGAAPDARLVDSNGVVLVDEIDLHIHPAWQRTIVPTLARALKHLQFIFTTHSPLVVGTLEQANIYTVDQKAGRPFVARPAAETFGLTAEQILRSDIFGLESTRDPEFRKTLKSLAVDAQEGKSGAAVELMRHAALGKAADGAPADEQPPEWLTKLAAG